MSLASCGICWVSVVFQFFHTKSAGDLCWISHLDFIYKWICFQVFFQRKFFWSNLWKRVFLTHTMNHCNNDHCHDINGNRSAKHDMLLLLSIHEWAMLLKLLPDDIQCEGFLVGVELYTLDTVQSQRLRCLPCLVFHSRALVFIRHICSTTLWFTSAYKVKPTFSARPPTLWFKTRSEVNCHASPVSIAFDSLPGWKTSGIRSTAAAPHVWLVEYLSCLSLFKRIKCLPRMRFLSVRTPLSVIELKSAHLSTLFMFHFPAIPSIHGNTEHQGVLCVCVCVCVSSWAWWELFSSIHVFFSSGKHTFPL